MAGVAALGAARGFAIACARLRNFEVRSPNRRSGLPFSALAGQGAFTAFQLVNSINPVTQANQTGSIKGGSKDSDGDTDGDTGASDVKAAASPGTGKLVDVTA